MSYFLPHLPSGWHVDEAIKSEEDRVVVLRFGHDWDRQCMTMDETLYSVADKVQNFAVIYLVDITDVPDFNKVCPKLAMLLIIRITLITLDVWAVWSVYRNVLLSVRLDSSSLYRSLTVKNRRNKHIMIDLGTGNNNKMYSAPTHRCKFCHWHRHRIFRNWAMDNKQEVRSLMNYELELSRNCRFSWLIS